VKLLLFDVDGTLMLSGGAAVRAMDQAFYEVFGVRGAFEHVKLAGRTDGSILEDAMARTRLRPIGPGAAEAGAGVHPADGDVARYKSVYFERFAEEIHRPVPLDPAKPIWHRFKGAYPGVRELLDALSRRPDVFLALLTGNYEQGARIKLEYVGLWRYFACGAFGDDSVNRPDLVPVAIERARAAGCPPVTPRDTVIIGDTPLDVACAREAGVRCVGVATGGFSVDALLAAGADVAFDTFADTDGVVRCLTTPGGQSPPATKGR
jgi:phosphoglycolate phosphatase-like HAD superfamily hydrolase